VLFPTPPPQPDAVMPHIILSSGLPAVVIGLFCAGALAASMSTGDALVHGAGAMAIEDVYRQLSGRSPDDHTRAAMIRRVAVAAGVLGYVMALISGRSLVGLLLMAYGAVVQLAPAVYAAFLWRRATAPGIVAGLVIGVAVTLVLVIQPAWRPWSIHEGLVGLAANALTAVGVSLVTRPPEDNHVTQWLAVSRGAQ
jgi:SSS family solute:Na+ symporter